MRFIMCKTAAKQTLFIVSVAFCGSAVALDHNDGKNPYEDITAVEISAVDTSRTIIGQDFKYPSGVPLIKAYAIEIPAGRQTALHKHLVPLFAHVISGELEVDYGSKGTRIIKAGTWYVEAMNWCHLGKAVGDQPVKVVGVYLGQIDPEQIKPENCAKPD